VRVGGGGRPLLRDHAVPDIKPARLEVEIGPALEDRADVLADLIGALRGLARRVVLEDHVGRVHRDDRVEVVVVPGLVVTPDRLIETLGRVLCHAESICSGSRGEQETRRRGEMADGYTIKRIDEFEEMEGSGGATWRLARKTLGAEAFGFNVVDIE